MTPTCRWVLLYAAVGVTLLGPCTPGEPFDDSFGGPVRIFLAADTAPEPPALSREAPPLWGPCYVAVASEPPERGRTSESRGPPSAET